MSASTTSSAKERLEVMEALEARQIWFDFELETREYGKKPKTGKNQINLEANIRTAWNNASKVFQDAILSAIKSFNAVTQRLTTASADADRLRDDLGEDDPVTGSKSIPDTEDDVDEAYEAYLGALERLIDLRQQQIMALRKLGNVQDRFKREINNESRKGVVAKLNHFRDQLNESKVELEDSQPKDVKEKKEEKRLRLDAGDLDSAWVGGWPLQEGSFGKAELWVKQNANGVIVDWSSANQKQRLVIKDARHSRGDWDDIAWMPDPQDVSKQIPCEVWAMCKLRGRVGAETVVQIRNWRIETSERMYRIYMEYCPYGDLCDIVNSMGYSGVRTYVPEPFLWYCFECLAIAGLLMERGELERNVVSDWITIVHRDIKLSNVFLGPPSASVYRAYPKPKLGDFGAAICAAEDDIRNPEIFGGTKGTEQNRPPEQRLCIHDGDDLPLPLNTKTNVWGIGNVIWSLMELAEGDPDLDYKDPDHRVPQLHTHSFDTYSDELLELVMDCTEYHPRDRPTFAPLLEKIRRHMRAGKRPEHVKALRLRGAPRENEEWKGQEIGLYNANLWVMGSSLAEVEQPLGDEIEIPDQPVRDGDGSDDDLGGPAGAEMNLIKRKASDDRGTDDTPPDDEGSDDGTLDDQASGDRESRRKRPKIVVDLTGDDG